MRSLAKFVTKPKTQTRGFLRVIDQAQLGYRQFLGMNRVRLPPGLCLKLPLFHDLRIVDMREGGIDVGKGEKLGSYTKDNVPVHVSGTLFFKVIDAEKACFEVQNYKSAIAQVGTSAARSIVGKFKYDEIISDRNMINKQLRETIGTSTEKWGIECSRFEIQSFEPQSKEVAHQLELQMQSEREKRKNENDTLANIRTAEGKKLAAINQSEGEKQAIENLADADRYAIDQKTEAMKNQLDQMAELFGGDHNKAANYLLAMKQVENMKAIANGPNNKIYFVPDKSGGLIPTAQMIADMFQNSQEQKD